MLRDDLVYKDECYRIVGVIYKVFKELGGDLFEKHYQKAVSVALRLAGIKNIEQFPNCTLKVNLLGYIMWTFE